MTEWTSMEDAWFGRYESRERERARLRIEAQCQSIDLNREAFLNPRLHAILTFE